MPEKSVLISKMVNKAFEMVFGRTTISFFAENGLFCKKTLDLSEERDII